VRPGESPDRSQVRNMFGAIAGRYDLLNRVLSLGWDAGWRRKAAAAVPDAYEPGAVLVDVCAGTGDLAVELARSRPAGLVVCADFSHAMLLRADAKLSRHALAGRYALVEANALSLPFGDGSVSAATVAFGVRNFSDRAAGCREILRVLRPGGRLVILEFSRPEGKVLPRLYALYLNRVLPRVGDWVSGQRGPYRYLARTIEEFPDAAGLAGVLREAGFAAVGWTPLTGGIVCIHTAIKGPVGASSPP
jgi:demethylmenaquinone methyltransferase / 2-methoxy-6-polyprenyl-1,4-benzoquinol methylase